MRRLCTFKFVNTRLCRNYLIRVDTLKLAYKWWSNVYTEIALQHKQYSPISGLLAFQQTIPRAQRISQQQRLHSACMCMNPKCFDVTLSLKWSRSCGEVIVNDFFWKIQPDKSQKLAEESSGKKLRRVRATNEVKDNKNVNEPAPCS